jgi:hypothetical protein
VGFIEEMQDKERSFRHVFEENEHRLEQEGFYNENALVFGFRYALLTC